MKSLDKNYVGKRWYPTNIEYIRSIIIYKDDYGIVSNICYTIQYLEYLNKQLNELKLSSVINKMLVKDYIVHGISLVEAIFYLSLKDRIKSYPIYKLSLNTLINKMYKINSLSLKKEDLLELKSLKRLRNKIHIYSSFDSYNTDYNSFNKNDLILIKTIINKIFNIVMNGKYYLK